MIRAFCNGKVVTHQTAQLRVAEPVRITVFSESGFWENSQYVLREVTNDILKATNDDQDEKYPLLEPQQYTPREKTREGIPSVHDFIWKKGFLNTGVRLIEAVEVSSSGEEHQLATLDFDVTLSTEKRRRFNRPFLYGLLSVLIPSGGAVLFYAIYAGGARDGDVTDKQTPALANIGNDICAACPDRIILGSRTSLPPSECPVLSCPTPIVCPEPTICPPNNVCPEPTICPQPLACPEPVVCAQPIVCPKPIVCEVCKACPKVVAQAKAPPQPKPPKHPPSEPGVTYYR